MAESNSLEYYRGRERHERNKAAACLDPGIAAIHAAMEDRYSELTEKADGEAGRRPKLRIV